MPFPPPGHLANQGTEPMSPVSPALQVDSLPLSQQGIRKEGCCCLVTLVMFDPVQHYGLQPARLLHPWDSPGKSTRVVVMPSSRGSSQLRDRTWVSCIAGRFLTAEPPGKLLKESPGQFSHTVMSASLRPHRLQHTRLPCPSPTPGACSNSSIESEKPSKHLKLYRPLLLPPSIFPSIRVFSNESVLHIRWPKFWSFSFSINPPKNIQD